MTPRIRRVVHAVLYEVIAIGAVAPAMAWIFDTSGASSTALAVVLSAVALAWNYVFNSLWEAWEIRQRSRRRTLGRRIAHGIGFEGGLTIFLVPIMAYWLDITWLNALVADLGILMFFLIYAIVFNGMFDWLFGLPASAEP